MQAQNQPWKLWNMDFVAHKEISSTDAQNSLDIKRSCKTSYCTLCAVKSVTNLCVL